LLKLFFLGTQNLSILIGIAFFGKKSKKLDFYKEVVFFGGWVFGAPLFECTVPFAEYLDEGNQEIIDRNGEGTHC